MIHFHSNIHLSSVLLRFIFCTNIGVTVFMRTFYLFSSSVLLSRRLAWRFPLPIRMNCRTVRRLTFFSDILCTFCLLPLGVSFTKKKKTHSRKLNFHFIFQDDRYLFEDKIYFIAIALIFLRMLPILSQ